ncbi:hypothetical protein AWB76_07741 [Caballeronia temeraria]|uniref:TniQ domain-containing protein n=2 Tax=Caballeronia temeraria TaxID=1777137 RepID=A0A158DYA2_9BURK|nr:hypothetical protein AWB76_07741 [Caballeronia temeraria]
MTRLEQSLLYVNRIVDDEDITGYVLSQLQIRSDWSPQTATGPISAGGMRLSWFHPSDLSSLRSAFGVVLPSTAQVIDKHTRFPIYAPFLSEDERAQLFEHYANSGRLSAFELNRLVGANAATFRGRLAVCPQCMDEDRRALGYTYWRRLHLMPGIQVCARHHRVLMTYCNLCEPEYRGARAVWAPHQRCICGGSLRPLGRLDRHSETIAVRFAKMSEDLMLARAPKTLDASSVRIAAERYCLTYGTSGRALYKTLRGSLEHALGEQVLVQAGLNETALKKLCNPKGALEITRNPAQNVLLVLGLFGGWDGFEQALSTTRSRVAERRLSPPTTRRFPSTDLILLKRRLLAMPEKDFRKIRGKHRAWLEAEIVKNPRLRRSQLPKLPGGYAAYQFFWLF